MPPKPLTYQQLIKKVAHNTHVQEGTADKIITQFIKCLAEELRIAGECTVLRLGKFYTTFYPGRLQSHSGIWVEERFLPHIKFSPYFKDMMNGRTVTPKGRYAQKQKAENAAKKKLKQQQLAKKSKPDESLEIEQMLDCYQQTGQRIDAQLHEKWQAKAEERERKKQEEAELQATVDSDEVSI